AESFSWLPAAVGGPETTSLSSVAAATLEDTGGKTPGPLVSPQELREQHQQLLQAVDLIRCDAELNLQRYTAGVDRIRKGTERNLQRFAAAVDAKIDRLNRSFSSERERELETFRRSNRYVLMTASAIAGMLL